MTCILAFFLTAALPDLGLSAAVVCIGSDGLSPNPTEAVFCLLSSLIPSPKVMTLFWIGDLFVDKELAHLVKTFYPDIRKILNNIQACVKNNELNILLS